MRRLVVLALVSVAALSACGGGDDEAAREEFIAKADRICKRTNAEGVRVEEPKQPSDFRGFAEETERIARKGVADLRRLDAPDSLKGDWDKTLANLDKQVDLLGGLADKADANDVKGLQTLLARGEALNRENDRLTSKIGFKQCGRSSG